MTAIGNASFLGDFPPGSAPPPKPAGRNFLIQDSVEGLLAKTSPTHPCPEPTVAKTESGHSPGMPNRKSCHSLCVSDIVP
jgi:hypothetical protein